MRMSGGTKGVDVHGAMVGIKEMMPTIYLTGEGLLWTRYRLVE